MALPAPGPPGQAPARLPPAVCRPHRGRTHLPILRAGRWLAGPALLPSLSPGPLPGGRAASADLGRLSVPGWVQPRERGGKAGAGFHPGRGSAWHPFPRSPATVTVRRVLAPREAGRRLQQRGPPLPARPGAALSGLAQPARGLGTGARAGPGPRAGGSEAAAASGSRPPRFRGDATWWIRLPESS